MIARAGNKSMHSLECGLSFLPISDHRTNDFPRSTLPPCPCDSQSHLTMIRWFLRFAISYEPALLAPSALPLHIQLAVWWQGHQHWLAHSQPGNLNHTIKRLTFSCARPVIKLWRSLCTPWTCERHGNGAKKQWRGVRDDGDRPIFTCSSASLSASDPDWAAYKTIARSGPPGAGDVKGIGEIEQYGEIC